jgi:hypothetical protein
MELMARALIWVIFVTGDYGSPLFWNCSPAT